MARPENDRSYTLPRGGQPAPPPSWYLNQSSDGKPKPFRPFKLTDYYRGLNLTITQFNLINDRIIALLKTNDRYKARGTPQQMKINLWPVYEAITSEFACLRSDASVPGWWALDATRAWIRDTAEWMACNPHRLSGESAPVKRRLPKPEGGGGGGEKKKKKKKRETEEAWEGNPPFERCCFTVCSREDPARNVRVPLVDLVRDGGGVGARPGELGDGRLTDLDARKLFGILVEKMRFDPRDRLVYFVTGGDGGLVEMEINNDVALWNAVVFLRGEWGYEMVLEVVSTAVLPREIRNMRGDRKSKVEVEEQFVGNETALAGTLLNVSKRSRDSVVGA
jgi:hypothetical protein